MGDIVAVHEFYKRLNDMFGVQLRDFRMTFAGLIAVDYAQQLKSDARKPYTVSPAQEVTTGQATTTQAAMTGTIT